MSPIPRLQLARDAATPLHVLVVDDSRMQLRILQAMLTKWGFLVSLAASAEEAIEMCRDRRPDLVISDWIMPGMSGPDFARAFRDMGGAGYGYFILLTSKSDIADIAEGLDAGADDFLTKPVSAPELRARLAAGIRVQRMERALTEQNRDLEEALEELQRLHAEIDRDLQQARRIQQALVPHRTLDVAGSRVSLLLKPCGHVGGDLVGAFNPGGSRMGVYGIDVSGHGITSAMVTARVAGYLSSTFPDQNLALERRFDRHFALRRPEEVADLLNRRLAADPGVDEYLTMAYVTADLDTGSMRLVQAGHPPPLLLRASGEMTFLGEGGVPIGLVPDVPYADLPFRMNPGDSLLIYSDGFTEAEVDGMAMLGEDGLVALFRETAASHSGEALLQAMFDRLRAQLATADLQDDVSAALIEYRPAGG